MFKTKWVLGALCKLSDLDKGHGDERLAHSLSELLNAMAEVSKLAGKTLDSTQPLGKGCRITYAKQIDFVKVVRQDLKYKKYLKAANIQMAQAYRT